MTAIRQPVISICAARHFRFVRRVMKFKTDSWMGHTFLRPQAVPVHNTWSLAYRQSVIYLSFCAMRNSSAEWWGPLSMATFCYCFLEKTTSTSHQKVHKHTKCKHYGRPGELKSWDSFTLVCFPLRDTSCFPVSAAPHPKNVLLFDEY